MSTQEVPQAEPAGGSAEPKAQQVQTPVPGWLGKDHGLSPDQVGWLSKWGYQGLGDVIKSTMSLEKLKGARAEELLRLPKSDADLPELWSKLGRPEKPDGYQLPEHKLDEGGIDLRPVLLPKAHEVGLTQKQVAALDSHLNEVLRGLGKRQDEAFAARVAQETEALRAEWGEQYDRRLSVASKAVEKLREASGLELSEGQLLAAEKVLGSAWLTKLMYGVAQMAGGIGEAQFVDGDVGERGVGMSRAAALAALEQFQADPRNREALTSGRSHPGYQAANRELVRLSMLAQED